MTNTLKNMDFHRSPADSLVKKFKSEAVTILTKELYAKGGRIKVNKNVFLRLAADKSDIPEYDRFTLNEVYNEPAPRNAKNIVIVYTDKSGEKWADDFASCTTDEMYSVLKAVLP